MIWNDATARDRLRTGSNRKRRLEVNCEWVREQSFDHTRSSTQYHVEKSTSPRCSLHSHCLHRNHTSTNPNDPPIQTYHFVLARIVDFPDEEAQLYTLVLLDDRARLKYLRYSQYVVNVEIWNSI